MNLISYLLFLIFIFTAQNISCQGIETVDLSKFFSGHEGSFVLYDYDNNKYIRHNPELCEVRFTPASTFKILNSLIGLETKAVGNENEIIKWDGREYRIMKEWMRDHDLKSAIKYSVVWFYQELARRIGEENMKYYLDETGFGNNDMSDGVDKFWLTGSLKVSSDEQVEFLKKLHENKLPFSQSTMDVVKSIMPGEDGENYKLRVKTGLNNIADDQFIGWYVGFVYTEDIEYIFAFNMLGSDVEFIRKQRIAAVKNILQHLEIIKLQ
ncbi:class D beta-lactamase [Bacteroidota bacterium]